MGGTPSWRVIVACSAATITHAVFQSAEATTTLLPEPLVAPPSDRLAVLTATNDVSTRDLLFMSYEAYDLGGTLATRLYGSPLSIGPWVPVATAPNLLVPAVVYQHNITGTKIVSFRGVYSDKSVCLGAKYIFPRSAAEPDFRTGCLQATGELSNASLPWGEAGGPGGLANARVNLSTVAAQTAQLLDEHPQVRLLTGHSLGCITALSAGRIRGIPVACFAAPGSFSAAWYTSFPGLAAAVDRSASSALPPRHLFTIQTQTDPLSNCLTPRLDTDPSRVWAASTCSFNGPPPGCADNVSLSYNITSGCVEQSHMITSALLATVPARFPATACSDLCEASLAVCPLLPPSALRHRRRHINV